MSVGGRTFKKPDVNQALRRLRLDGKGWTHEELSREAKLSSQTVRKAERGLPISDVSMAKIAKALDTSVDTLFPVASSTARPR